MKENEFKVLEQLNDIDDDLLMSAEKTPRKLSPAPVYGIAAAVIVSVIALAVFNPFKRPGTPAGPENKGNNPVIAENDDVTQTPAGEQTQGSEFLPEAPVEKKVLYAAANDTNGQNEAVPNRGNFYIAAPLCHEITKEEYKDCLFAVKLSLYHTYDELYKELHDKGEALYRSKISEYDRLFDEWQKQITSNDPRFTEGKSIDEYPESVHAFGWPEYYGYTPEEFWSRGSNHLYIGLMIMYDDFNKYLKDKMPEAEYNELMAAHKEYLELIDEVDGSRTMIRELTKNVHMDEVERLKALGLDVKLEEREDGWTSITGVLTPEQISDFPASSKYGYLIIWQGHDNAINE